MRPPNCLGMGFAQSERADLALFDQPRHGADGIFDRHGRIDAVLVIEVDHVHAQPLEARLARTDDEFRTAVRDLAAATRAQIAELRRQHDFGTAPLDRLANELFVVTEAVHVGRVEKRDAPVERLVNESNAGRVVARTVGAGKRHAAEADRG